MIIVIVEKLSRYLLIDHLLLRSVEIEEGVIGIVSSNNNHMKGRMSQKSLDTWNVLRYRFIGGGPMVRRRQFVHLLTERGGSIDIRFIIVSLIVSLMMRSLCGNGFHILTLSREER